MWILVNSSYHDRPMLDLGYFLTGALAQSRCDARNQIARDAYDLWCNLAGDKVSLSLSEYVRLTGLDWYTPRKLEAGR